MYQLTEMRQTGDYSRDKKIWLFEQLIIYLPWFSLYLLSLILTFVLYINVFVAT